MFILSKFNILAKSNDLIRNLQSIIDSLLLEKLVCPSQTMLLLYWETYLKWFAVTLYYGACFA